MDIDTPTAIQLIRELGFAGLAYALLWRADKRLQQLDERLRELVAEIRNARTN